MNIIHEVVHVSQACLSFQIQINGHILPCLPQILH